MERLSDIATIVGSGPTVVVALNHITARPRPRINGLPAGFCASLGGASGAGMQAQ